MTAKKFNHEGHEEHEALARSLHSLEYSEGSEKRMKLEIFGSLKFTREAGCPDKLIGTSGELWRTKISNDPQGPHQTFKRSSTAMSIYHFNKFELPENSVSSVRDCRGVLRMLRKIVLLIGLAMLVACASDIPSVKTLARHQGSNPSADKSDAGYVIGPGDILSIDVWKEKELSKQVSVRLDGKISLPLVNDVQAAGLTSTELRNQLTEQYKDFVDVPEVAVTVIESRSKRIYLLGKVVRPGEYLMQKDMTVVQAVSVAGGLAEWADSSDVKLIRKINGIEKTFSVDYDAIVSGEDLGQNVQLQPDDTIFVP
jgi:polysaccharide export outer membrane protein